MKRRLSAPMDPLQLIDKQSKAHHALHVALTGATLHDDLLAFLHASLGRPVQLSARAPSVYLRYPVEDSSCTEALRARIPGATEEQLTRVLHSLCEPAAVLCARSVLRGEDHEALMGRMEGMTSTEQLEAMWEPLRVAGLHTVPCEMESRDERWNASKRLYSSRFLAGDAGDVLTLSGEATVENIVVGHAEFRVAQWVDAFLREGTHRACAFPVYLCNYLQDERLYQLHAAMIVAFRASGLVWLVDPNGQCPDDFGEPNAVFLKLPWTRQ